MLRTVFRLLACALWLAVVAGLRAELALFHPESGRPSIRDFRPTEYRGHPQVYGLVQGPDNLMYLSSQEGIISFDGARWTHHPMPSANVYELLATPDGRIWAGAIDELGYYAPTKEGDMIFHSLRATLPASVAPWGRTTSVRRHDGAMYFSSARGVIRVRDDRIDAVWPASGADRKTLHHVGNELMLHVQGQGLFRLTPGEPTLFMDAAPLRESTRTVSTRLADGRVLFCGTNAGVFLLDHVRRTMERVPGILDEVVRTTRATAALTFADGTMAVATSGQGLFFLGADLRQVRRLDRTTGLADNAVLSLARDREGGLWLGYNSGMARLAIESGVSVFDATNGPTPGTIDAWGRHADRLYVGTYDGLYRMEPPDAAGHGGAFVRINRDVTNIFSIESYAGQLLVGATLGLYQVANDGTAQLVLPTRENNIYAVVASRRIPGRFYLAGGSGLTVVQHDATGWRKIAERLDLGDGHTALLEDDGTLWRKPVAKRAATNKTAATKADSKQSGTRRKDG